MVQVTPQGVDVIKSLICSYKQNSNIPAAIETAHVLCEMTESDGGGHTRKGGDVTKPTEEIQENFLSAPEPALDKGGRPGEPARDKGGHPTN